MSISGWRWLDGHSMLVMSMDGPLLSMDGHSMLVMSTTLGSKVSLVLFYLKAVQSISAIQNAPHLLDLISLQNVFRLLVFICHVFSRTTCPTQPYAKYLVQWSVLYGANTYIMHSESRLCRFAVASLRFLRSDELFQHHTSSSRSRKDCYHKRRHQGSR